MEYIKIRPAVPEDAGEILRIYAHYVRETTITFEYDVPSEEEFRERIRTISAEYPYLVCLVDGRIAAYAYAHRHMERAAYQWNAELSVYVDKALVHMGIGRALYQAVLEILALQNIQTVYGIVTSPNPGSQHLHEAMGFTRAVTFKNMGYKFGRWLDVAWYEKALGDHNADMKPFLPVHRADGQKIGDILAVCEQKIAAGRP